MKTPELRKLGHSDLELTRIGFGAWAVGAKDWSPGYSDDDSVQAIRRAMELGVGWIDTAAVYGLGHSEVVIAKALEGVNPRPLIFTKCGLIWDQSQHVRRTLKCVRQECEASLRRLKVDAIDLYQIHWPAEGAQDEVEEGWMTMAELQREGKVRWLGVSNLNVQQMERAMKIAPVTSLQPPYSLINRDSGKELLPFCKQHGIGAINYSPMQSGMLTGGMTREEIAKFDDDDFRKNSKYFKEPELTKNLALTELLKEIGKRHSVSAGVVAVAWTQRNDAITASICGAREPYQVDAVAPALRFELGDAEAKEIEARL